MTPGLPSILYQLGYTGPRQPLTCQGMCLTTVFAIRGTACHCLGESYTPANDIDCIPIIVRSPNLNSQNRNAKTVFKTVTLGINGPSTDRCLAQNNSNGCNYELRRCSDSLRIMCKAGTYVPASWEEAAYDCTSANSFPRPVPDICIPGTAGSTEWYGGFRLLQYIPGSTDGTFCKRLSYSTQYAAPTFKEVSCDSTFRFYCSYTESGYNEPCEATIASSCDVNFVCSDRTGTPKCRCTEDKYWDDTYRICRTRKVYANRCDTSIPDVCADGLSCQSSGGSYTCHCKEDRYLDKKARTAKQENHMMKVVMPAYRMCVNAAFLVRLQMRIPNVVVVRAWSGTQPVEVAKHGGPTTKAVLTVYRGFV
ncbi:uncharacterized protein [Argopecten irradians]|uniref:uncharacterized protein isoform X3 n=1 Tax=Argopecten irradians TaxID=31199 RepID=UPI0037224530